jgi:ABC-type antimicrobial peptide transport system ATPase subunit
MRYLVIYDFLYRISDKDHKEIINILNDTDVSDSECEKMMYEFHKKIEPKYKKLDKHITVCY